MLSPCLFGHLLGSELGILISLHEEVNGSCCLLLLLELLIWTWTCLPERSVDAVSLLSFRWDSLAMLATLGENVLLSASVAFVLRDLNLIGVQRIDADAAKLES